jgi:carboxylate-amine ligase
MLYRLGEDNQRWRIYSRMLISENTWRAQRYGIAGSLIDFGRGELVPVLNLTDEIVEMVREDAEELNCVEEVEHARHIARTGTSAQRQLDVYRGAIADGASEREALIAVVDHLIVETVAGT